MTLGPDMTGKIEMFQDAAWISRGQCRCHV